MSTPDLQNEVVVALATRAVVAETKAAILEAENTALKESLLRSESNLKSQRKNMRTWPGIFLGYTVDRRPGEYGEKWEPMHTYANALKEAFGSEDSEIAPAADPYDVERAEKAYVKFVEAVSKWAVEKEKKP